jgi:FkbM family methyltransferase
VRGRLLALLACPACGSGLTLDDADSLDPDIAVADGRLACDGCSRWFPIVRGVPRLLPPDKSASDPVAEHFEVEFTALADRDLDFDGADLLEYLFFSRTGIDPHIYDALPGDPYRTSLPEGGGGYRPDGSFLNGKRVLDAGCGGGRLTTVAAQHAEHVIALDIGAHVERAQARCAPLGNVDVVQGSVLDPPLKRQTIDFAFSVGVLHHTPDPSGGCEALAELVTDGGAMAVWVYPPEYWGGPLRASVNRSAHTALSRLPPRLALAVIRGLLYPLGRAQMALAKRPGGKLIGAPLFALSVPRHPQREVMLSTIHDYFCPPIISTHSPVEVSNWMAEGGFGSIQVLPVQSSCLGRRASRPTRSATGDAAAIDYEAETSGERGIRERLKRGARRLRAVGPLNAVATTAVRASLRATGRDDSFAIKHLHRYGKVRVPVGDGRAFVLETRGDDWIPNQLFWRGLDGYEPETLPLFLEYAARSRGTIDVGAHIGVFAIAAATVNPSAPVLAVEPLPEAFERLAENVARNSLTNVVCCRTAAGKEAGRATLYRAPVSVLPSASSLSREFLDPYYDGLQTIAVDVSPLDALCADYGIERVDLMKIDTEGTEPDVLTGLTEVLRRDRPTIFCEILGSTGVEAAIESKLSPLGYRYYHLLPTGPAERSTVRGDEEHRNWLFSAAPPPRR